jgi:hypothetical protein
MAPSRIFRARKKNIVGCRLVNIRVFLLIPIIDIGLLLIKKKKEKKALEIMSTSS